MLKRTLSFVLVLTMLATCLFILPVSADETSAFIYIKDSGYWYDTPYMQDHEFLNINRTSSSYTYSYDNTNKIGTFDVSNTDSTQIINFNDLSKKLAINSESSGELEISLDVKITKVPGANWFVDSTPSTYWGLYMYPFFDGVKGSTDEKWKGLLTKYKSAGENGADPNIELRFPDNYATATIVDWTDEITIPIKLVVSKTNGTLTVKNYAKMNNQWVASEASTLTWKSTGEFTGFGLRFGGTSFSGNKIRYILSNVDVIEKTPETVRLSDVSSESYNLSDKKDVKLDFVLPEGVTEASLTVDGTKVADVTPAEAGAYAGTLDLAKIGKIGNLPVVLSGKANGAEFSQSTTINVARPEFGSLDKTILSDPVAGGEFIDREAMSNAKFLLPGPTSSSVAYSTEGEGDELVATLVANSEPYTISFADAPDLIRVGQPGTQIVEIQGSIAMPKYTSDISTVSMQWLPYVSSSVQLDQVDDWGTALRNNSAGGLHIGSSTIVSPYQGEFVQMKWRYTFTDSATAGAKDVTMQPYFRLSDQDEWTKAEEASNTKTGVKDATMGKISIRLRDENASSQTNKATIRFKNFSIKELAPQEAAITDLSAQTYVGSEVVPVSICLPANYKEAVLTAGDTDIATFKGVAAGGYTADLSIAGLKTTGRVPLTLSGTTTDDKTFTASTNFYIAAPAAGSLDEALFSDPVASAYYADKVMTNAEVLDRSLSTITYEFKDGVGIITSPLSKDVNEKFLDFNSLRFNELDNAELEIYMEVEAKPLETAKDYPAAGNFWKLTFDPYVDGVRKIGSADGSRYYGLTLRNDNYTNASDEDLIVFPKYNSYGNNYAVAETAKIPYRVLATKNDGVITFTHQAMYNGAWVEDNGNSTVTINSGKLTGVGLWLGSNSEATESFNWKLSNAKITDKAIEYAEIRDLSAGFYTQYDTVPVDFNLPTGYKDAMITVDGTPVAVFDAATGDNAGSWQSKLNLKKLGKVGAVKIGLQGTMNGGGTFSKASTLNVKAASSSTGYTDTTPTLSNATASSNNVFELTSATYGSYATIGAWSKYDSSTNPYGPFLTQYCVELSADVDFTNGVPGLWLVGRRADKDSGQWDNTGLVEVLKTGAKGITMTDGTVVPVPEQKFNLKVRVFTTKNEDGYGHTLTTHFYFDDVYMGANATSLDVKRGMSDEYGKLNFGFKRHTGCTSIGLQSLNWRKFAVLTVSNPVVEDKKVSVTLDKALDAASISNITLTKADGTLIDATPTLSTDGKTVTLTAEKTLPADVQVVFGENVKEANREFMFTATTASQKTYQGAAITTPLAISANNTAAELQGTDLKVWESGQNAIIKATVNGVADSNAKLIVAAYKTVNGLPKLVESKIETLSETGLKDYVFNLQFDNNYDYFKVFLWNGFSGMESLYDSQKTN